MRQFPGLSRLVSSKVVEAKVGAPFKCLKKVHKSPPDLASEVVLKLFVAAVPPFCRGSKEGNRCAVGRYNLERGWGQVKWFEGLDFYWYCSLLAV